MNNTKKTVTILVVVDAIGVLSSGMLNGNIYLFDNNRLNGSTGEGTQALKTKVDCKRKEQFTLLWNIMSMDPEAFVQISGINADENYLKVSRNRYEDSDIDYWTGTVEKAFDILPYELLIKIGNSNNEYRWTPELLGK